MVPLELKLSEDFVSDLADRVAGLVAGQLSTGAQWLTTEGAAEHLSLSAESVRALVKRGKVPYTKLPNNRIRFERAELDAWARGERE